MENDILDSLEDLGYAGPLLEDDLLTVAIEEGSSSVEFTKLIEWFTKELSGFYNIEEHANCISGPDDTDTFLMELSGFLREYGCPHACLITGPIGQRLSSRSSKLLLLDFLLTELEAARIVSVQKPHLITTNAIEVEQVAESEAAKYMKQMLIALGFPKPPEGITPFQLFSKVEKKVKELLGQTPSDYTSKPLLKARLSDKQWDNINYINQALTQEYDCRREMLLKRLDVTVQSFRWSDRAKQKEDVMAAKFQPLRKALSPKSIIDVHHLLSAREDLLNIEKTSSGDAREKTKCAINKVMIGKVPDRGGRAYELEPPPPEMPSFQQRQNQPQRGGRGGWSGNRRGHGSSWDKGGGHYHGQGSGGGGQSYKGGGGYWKQNKRTKYY